LALSYSGTALPVANGGTGVTTSTGTGSVVLNTGASLGSATVSDYETFASVSAPTYSEGRIWYDSTIKALTYNSDISGNSLHVGQETQLKVRNSTGSTIAKGSPVYITSTSTGVSFPNIALAQANTLTTGNAIGLTNEAIASGADGYVVINGLLNGVNTGTFTVGDILYVSPYSAGQLMNTFPPTGYPVRIGVVSFVNSSTGSIYINQSNAFVQASSVVGTLAVANGGTGVTTSTGTGSVVLSTSPTLVTPLLGTPTSGNFSTGTFTWPTFNQNTTGTAANVTGTVAIANGGTGQTTAAAAITALTGTQTNAYYLRSNGTNATLSGLSAADLTGTVAVANGGTGINSFGTGVATWLGTPSSANLISAVTDETGSGLLVFNNTPSLTNPTVTNYVETPYSANSSTAITLALTNGTVQIITLTGNATITMPTAVSGKSFIMLLRQDATGSRTVTWSTVKWAGGTAPTITSTASKQDIYSFFSDGSSWYGVTVGQNYTQ
jgi:hypothetical protein